MNNEFDYYPTSNTEAPSGFLRPEPPSGHAKGYATASLCLGIAALFCTLCCCCFYMLTPICAIIAIVMACLARRDNNRKLSGLAVAGLVTAIIGLVLFAFILIFEIIMLALPTSQIQEILRQVIEENYGITFEEYLDAILE